MTPLVPEHDNFTVTCPHCWQAIEMLLDGSAGGQTYIQDCEVCCNPLEVTFEVLEGRIENVQVSGIDQ